MKKMIRPFSKIAIIGSIALSTLAYGVTFPMPQGEDDLIGQIQTTHATTGEKIYDLIQRYDIGFYEMVEANPTIPRYSEVPPEETLVIPSEYILPDVKREGIVVNLPELRLYYYMPEQGVVVTHPLAIGRYEWITPTIVTKIIDKQKDPYWHVPKSIKAAAAKKGIYWPDVVPPGPKNPLGKYALRLGNRSYLIHGTENPKSIGKRASSGCMRMYPEDIESLFNLVNIGTPVRIVNEWYKLGTKNGKLYVEIHEPLQETAEPKRVERAALYEAIQKIEQEKNATIDWQAVDEAYDSQNGLPTAIGTVNDEQAKTLNNLFYDR